MAKEMASKMKFNGKSHCLYRKNMVKNISFWVSIRFEWMDLSVGMDMDHHAPMAAVFMAKEITFMMEFTW